MCALRIQGYEIASKQGKALLMNFIKMYKFTETYQICGSVKKKGQLFRVLKINGFLFKYNGDVK